MPIYDTVPETAVDPFFKVKVAGAVIVAASISVLKVAATFELRGTSAARSAGIVAETEGS
jgi:hypothetical protein